MDELTKLVDAMYASKKTHTERFFAVSESHHAAFKEYMKYKNLAGSYHDLPSEAQREIRNGVEDLLRYPNSMPADVPRQALLAYDEVEKLYEQAKRAFSSDIEAVAHYLGVKPGSIDEISKDSIRIIEIVDCHHQTLTIPRSHLTLEGMQQYKDHPILKDSQLWGKMLKAGTSAEAAVEQAAPAAENAAKSAAEHVAPVVEDVSKGTSAGGHSLPSVERDVGKAEQAAEGLWAQFTKMHWSKKTAIVGGTVVLGATIGYWLFKSKQKKDEEQQTASAQL